LSSVGSVTHTHKRTHTHTPNEDGSWTCPRSIDVLQEAGLCTIDEYIDRRRETVARFVEETTNLSEVSQVKSLINKCE
jgi:hypothetical protein